MNMIVEIGYFGVLCRVEARPPSSQDCLNNQFNLSIIIIIILLLLFRIVLNMVCANVGDDPNCYCPLARRDGMFGTQNNT